MKKKMSGPRRKGEWQTLAGEACWGPTGSKTVGPGATTEIGSTIAGSTDVIVGLVPVASPSPNDIAIGAVDISVIDIHLLVFCASALNVPVIGGYSFEIGAYLTTWDSGALDWETQNPNTAPDVCRDNWLLLEGYSKQVGANSTNNSPLATLKRRLTNIRISEGRALMLRIHNETLSTSGLIVVPYIRWKQTLDY